jgi:hypothetical protein
MPTIVISYRRADVKAVAGRIYDRLASRYGAASVFMDVDHIPLGIDYRSHIKSVLTQSDVLLAVIGPAWLGARPDGRRRIDEAADPVRLEVETALGQGARVIPLLVDDTPMPGEPELPESLKDFAFLNAAPIDSGQDFGAHMARLIASLDQILKDKGAGPVDNVPAPPQRTSRRTGRIAAAGVGAIALAVLAAYGWSVLRSAPLDPERVGWLAAATGNAVRGPAPAAGTPASASTNAAAPASAPAAREAGPQPVVATAAPEAAVPAAPQANGSGAAAAPPSGGKLFQVLSTGVSDGILNMRAGPGTRHPLVVSIPAGQSGVVLSGECRMPDDGGRKPWCKARWLHYEGWLSTCCVVDAAGAFPKVDLAAGALIE